MLPQQYSLRWKHHHTNVQSMFSQLLEKERFCDVTLYCNDPPSVTNQKSAHGVSLRAHRVVLASCSGLFAELLGAHDAETRTVGSAEPMLVIDGADPKHMKALLDYMYTGEMSVHHSELPSLLKTAEELMIKGLSDIRWNNQEKSAEFDNAVLKNDTTNKLNTRQVITNLINSTSGKDGAAVAPPAVSNGEPPPLIKLDRQIKSHATNGDKNITAKRENNQIDAGGSPKRQKIMSQSENTDEDDREPDWTPKNIQDYYMNLCEQNKKPPSVGLSDSEEGSGGEGEGECEAEGDGDSDEPHDIASFLDATLRVDGEGEGEDEAEEHGSDDDMLKSPSLSATDQKNSDLLNKLIAGNTSAPNAGKGVATPTATSKNASGKEGRFSDVVKLNTYLQYGRRPHFWEEEYVKKVMEAVRLKELEMKQAAEILGVSYGTLYGRYRDVYGCINRPYRLKEFWSEQSQAEVLARLHRGEVSLGAAAEALATTPQTLAAYLAIVTPATATATVTTTGSGADAEPAPHDVENAQAITTLKSIRKNITVAERVVKKILTGATGLPGDAENAIPVTTIELCKETREKEEKPLAPVASANKPQTGGIRVASIESLREKKTPSTETSPSKVETAALLKARPDLTIVPATAVKNEDDAHEGNVT